MCGKLQRYERAPCGAKAGQCSLDLDNPWSFRGTWVARGPDSSSGSTTLFNAKGQDAKIGVAKQRQAKIQLATVSLLLDCQTRLVRSQAVSHRLQIFPTFCRKLGTDTSKPTTGED